MMNEPQTDGRRDVDTTTLICAAAVMLPAKIIPSSRADADTRTPPQRHYRTCPSDCTPGSAWLRYAPRFIGAAGCDPNTEYNA